MILAIALSIGAAACGHRRAARPPADATPHGSPARREAARLDLALVAVKARIGDREVHSSGTVIDGDRGLVLTSAHSVWGASSLKLATGVAVVYGRIVARSPCDDIALVEVQPWIPGLVALPLASGAPAPGPVTAVERIWTESDSDVVSVPARTARSRHRLRGNAMLAAIRGGLALDGGLGPEASGGPLLDSSGRVAAVMAVTRDRDSAPRSVAVPVSLVRERLRDLRPGPGTVYVGWGEYYRCAPLQQRYAAAAYPGFRRRDARLNAPVPASRLRGTGELDG